MCGLLSGCKIIRGKNMNLCPLPSLNSDSKTIGEYLLQKTEAIFNGTQNADYNNICELMETLSKRTKEDEIARNFCNALLSVWKYSPNKILFRFSFQLMDHIIAKIIKSRLEAPPKFKQQETDRLLAIIRLQLGQYDPFDAPFFVFGYKIAQYTLYNQSKQED